MRSKRFIVIGSVVAVAIAVAFLLKMAFAAAQTSSGDFSADRQVSDDIQPSAVLATQGVSVTFPSGDWPWYAQEEITSLVHPGCHPPGSGGAAPQPAQRRHLGAFDPRRKGLRSSLRNRRQSSTGFTCRWFCEIRKSHKVIATFLGVPGSLIGGALAL